MSGSDPNSDAPLLGLISAELVARHGCHTVVLYGSRAAGSATEASDYDVLGVRASGEKTRDVRRFHDAFLDAAVHPESDFAPDGELAAEFVRLRAGRVLLQKGDFGDRLVARAAGLFKAGPKPLDAAERGLVTAWIPKMLARVARAGGDGDDAESVEGNYRRVWLLYQMLEDYFRLRGRWYLGPKESIAWLEANDRATFACLADALRPDASRSSLRRLAERVLDAE